MRRIAAIESSDEATVVARNRKSSPFLCRKRLRR
jgi:hypothetical protein